MRRLGRARRVKDSATQEALSTVHHAVGALQDLPFSDGALIEDIAIEAGVKKIVKHTLGRPYRGWITVRRDARILEYEDGVAPNNSELWLNAASNVTLSIWVF